MAFSGTLLYENGTWTSVDRDTRPDSADPWLKVDVQDTATITYGPAPDGVVHLGDTAEEAADGLVQWWARTRDSAEGIDDKRRKIAEYLAEPLDRAKAGEDAGAAYIEIKTSRFLVALDLPVPDALLH
ncbi:hypothetical protein [Actinocrispum sp. NPDC049592]|uniref:hypothetical protein n=1 Tax=Actinocrispum sp. NPDC049592 TaxID=3154835 RepID=UPI0034471AEC